MLRSVRDAREIPERVYEAVVRVVSRGRVRWRVDDELRGPTGRRRHALLDATGQRVLGFRLDALERGTIVGAPRFFMGAASLRFAARELAALTFAVRGRCLAVECRCRGLAGARVYPGLRGRCAIPPLHPDCACVLVQMESDEDVALAQDLVRYAAGVNGIR